MTRYDRRRFARIAATGACLPAFTTFASLVNAQTSRLFRPHDGPYTLSRTLVRDLSDGKTITVHRDWRVTFSQTGQSHRLDGEQVAVSVEAPAKLSALADIERGRVESGIFPLWLDHSGKVIRESKLVNQHDVTSAMTLARKYIAESPLNQTERTHSRQFLRALHNKASMNLSYMRSDLFLPAELYERETRSMDFPNGEMGRVTIEFSAGLAPEGGIMEMADSHIKTVVADTAMESIERWALTPE